MQQYPKDWPGPGPIDLTIHDLPHASSMTEWWYFHSHITTVDKRSLAVFGSFFRIIKGKDKITQEPLYAHSLTWAISDLDRKTYVAQSLVDKDAVAMGKKKLERGEGSRDPRLRRAMAEVLDKGNIPHPDRMFRQEPFVNLKRLELDFDGNLFYKKDDGSYQVELFHKEENIGCSLNLIPQKPPTRHGDNGVVKGTKGEDMFYYFIPRCDVQGSMILDGLNIHVTESSGWYDHEFGGHRAKAEQEAAQKGEDAAAQEHDIAWNWLAAQLDDGSELTAYTLVDEETQEVLENRIVLIDADNNRSTFTQIEFTPLNEWTSTRTFNTYPTNWKLTVPESDIELDLQGSIDDQEFVTLISKPAFWEGRCEVSGNINGKKVTGRGYIERSGFLTIDDLDSFFKAVSRKVRESVRALIPLEPTYEQVLSLIADKSTEHYMDGVSIEQFRDTMIKPVREITDRGGKAWRSYAALACCDVVGGDSRQYVQWLAMPELMHVGSLIVDDVQDRSVIRRGGKTCHEIYGDSIAINAGTACYFMGQKLLRVDNISDHALLRIYDLYFAALRAGHAGQAIDIDGLDAYMPQAIETGDSQELEERVLAIHRLKTAVPAGTLSRMGSIAGGGTEEQVQAVGRFFESIGLAFQIIDDVLNLRGFKGNLKSRGEDIAQGKITLPVAKAISRLSLIERQWLWEKVSSKPQDQETIEEVIAKLEECNAINDCDDMAKTLVEEAWEKLDPLVEDSMPKLMLRSFGWYVLERHY